MVNNALKRRGLQAIQNRDHLQELLRQTLFDRLAECTA
jgi:hypothetical protein